MKLRVKSYLLVLGYAQDYTSGEFSINTPRHRKAETIAGQAIDAGK